MTAIAWWKRMITSKPNGASIHRNRAESGNCMTMIVNATTAQPTPISTVREVVSQR